MICLLGGTFDPVHFGHLRPALEVQQALGIPSVHLLPCRVPPHRNPPVGSPQQRLALLRLAVEDEPALDIDERELRREGPSYMVDTLKALRADIGQEPLCLALGMDAFLELESWYRWQELIRLSHLVVMQRPGSHWPQEGALAELVNNTCVKTVEPLRRQAAGFIAGIPVTQLAVSSTRIRELLATGKSPRYLMPDAVLNRIKLERWYANR